MKNLEFFLNQYQQQQQQQRLQPLQQNQRLQQHQLLQQNQLLLQQLQQEKNKNQDQKVQYQTLLKEAGNVVNMLAQVVKLNEKQKLETQVLKVKLETVKNECVRLNLLSLNTEKKHNALSKKYTEKSVQLNESKQLNEQLTKKLDTIQSHKRKRTQLEGSIFTQRESKKRKMFRRNSQEELFNNGNISFKKKSI